VGHLHGVADSAELREVYAEAEARITDFSAALGQHRGWLRGEVAKRLATKYTPDLSFRRDDSFDAGARIDEVLRRPEIARDLPPAGTVQPWKSLADSMDDDVGDD
jgi:hypothetical protein